MEIKKNVLEIGKGGKKETAQEGEQNCWDQTEKNDEIIGMKLKWGDVWKNVRNLCKNDSDML